MNIFQVMLIVFLSLLGATDFYMTKKKIIKKQCDLYCLQIQSTLLRKIQKIQNPIQKSI